jgi:NADH dehydrogenase
MDHRPRVVVIGAGFGGLAAVRALAHAPVDVVLVDANNYHLFQPLLYQVATAGLDSDDIAAPARGVFRRQRNVDFRMAEVRGVSLDERVVRLSHGAPISYDHLIVAAGAIINTYGVPGVEEHAFELKSLPDAVRLRSHILRQFEAVAGDPALLEAGALTVVIVGGGATGVELAGGLVELFSMVLAKDFRRLDVTRARVVLLELSDRLLGTFNPRLSDRALRTLRRRGVEITLGAAVDKVDASGVHLADGNHVPAQTVVWTAGVKGNPVGSMLGPDVVANGRIPVQADLSLPDHPEVFVIGDLGAPPKGPNGWLPQVAPAAIQGGRHAARQILAAIQGRPGSPFRYRDKGSMAAIGRQDAVVELPGGIRLSGPIAWLAWLGLHLVELVGFRNRANVLVNWAWNYLTYDRGSRLVGSEFAESGHPATFESGSPSSSGLFPP